MDSRDRLESYSKWKSGEVKIMVATKVIVRTRSLPSL